jgi:uncharacterized protein YjbI with pentapeptide repeats
MERAGSDTPKVQIGARLYPAIRANLSQALLTDAKLREANLVGADLSGAQLQGVDLTKANLSYANVQRVNLSYANVQRVNLSGATLTWAILDEADVRGTKVSEEQLQTVVSEKNAKRQP